MILKDTKPLERVDPRQLWTNRRAATYATATIALRCPPSRPLRCNLCNCIRQSYLGWYMGGSRESPKGTHCEATSLPAITGLQAWQLLHTLHWKLRRGKRCFIVCAAAIVAMQLVKKQPWLTWTASAYLGLPVITWGPYMKPTQLLDAK